MSNIVHCISSSLISRSLSAEQCFYLSSSVSFGQSVTALHICDHVVADSPLVLSSSMPNVLNGVLASPARCQVHLEHASLPLPLFS